MMSTFIGYVLKQVEIKTVWNARKFFFYFGYFVTFSSVIWMWVIAMQKIQDYCYVSLTKHTGHFNWLNPLSTTHQFIINVQNPNFLYIVLQTLSNLYVRLIFLIKYKGRLSDVSGDYSDDIATPAGVLVVKTFGNA